MARFRGSTDYSQIEPRIFAYFVAKGLGDTTIADWYREGRDVYREIAGRAYGKPADEITEEERDNGKLWFLMTLYSAGPKKIALEQKIPYAEAKEFYLAFHEGLPQIKALSNPRPQSEAAMRHWKPGLIETTLKRRRYLTTPWGRHLHPEKWGEHKMLNKLIQGSAADMMKHALLRVDRWQREQTSYGLRSRMVATIHDEILFDGPVTEVEELHSNIPFLMADEPWLTEVVPIKVDHEVYTTSWAEKQKYEAWRESALSEV
ncbi:MAG: hypothetical protein LC118_16450 [Dehalococcoidia bacterium]|nr:hypothetical protein [Dehalococcoidia bacterium]